MNNRSIFIAASVFMFSMIVSLVDAVIHPPYAAKIPIKILFFFILPMVFFMANKADFYEFRKLFLLKKKRYSESSAPRRRSLYGYTAGLFPDKGFYRFFQCHPKPDRRHGNHRRQLSLCVAVYFVGQFLSGGILFQGLRFHHPEKIHGQEICIHFQFINIRGISRWYAFRNVSYRRIVSASFGANDWRLYFQLSERAE